MVRGLTEHCILYVVKVKKRKAICHALPRIQRPTRSPSHRHPIYVVSYRLMKNTIGFLSRVSIAEVCRARVLYHFCLYAYILLETVIVL